MAYNELSPRKQAFLREVLDPTLSKEQRYAVAERYGYKDVQLDGISSNIDGLVGLVQRIRTPVVPGWVTPELTAMLTGLTSRSEAALYTLNRYAPLTPDDVHAIGGLYLKDGVPVETAEELQKRRDNLIHLQFRDGEVVGVHKLFDRDAGLDLEQSHKLGLWAVRSWQNERYGEDLAVSYRGGDEWNCSIDDNGVQVGCQFLARPDVLRICALMGWGLEKSEGPQPVSTSKEAEPV